MYNFLCTIILRAKNTCLTDWEHGTPLTWNTSCMCSAKLINLDRITICHQAERWAVLKEQQHNFCAKVRFFLHTCCTNVHCVQNLTAESIWPTYHLWPSRAEISQVPQPTCIWKTFSWGTWLGTAKLILVVLCRSPPCFCTQLHIYALEIVITRKSWKLVTLSELYLGQLKFPSSAS